MRSILSSALLTAGMLLTGGSAWAQGSPSADAIINSLRPGGNMTGSTRGIRLAPPSDVPAAAAGRPGVARPVGPAAVASSPGTAAPSVSMTVQFATDSAELTPAATRTLDELGRALSSQALSAYKFRIEGHTDTVGTRDHNVALSQARAAKVVEYLASKYNVDRAKVEAVGVGPDEPLVRTGANVAEPRNRRVTVVNVGT